MSEKIEKVLVDPATAAAWLKKVPEHQRNVRAAVAALYAKDMSEGTWLCSQAHSPLAFNERGEMIQGQHRLRGVALSGTSQWFYVVRGVTDAVTATLDNGIKRSGGDVLTLAGYLNGSQIATIAGTYHWYLNDFAGDSGKMLTSAELLDFVAAHNGMLQEARQVGNRARRAFRGSESAIATASFAVALTTGDPFAPAPFDEVLVTGVATTHGHPAALLRQRLERMDRDKSGNRGRSIRTDTVRLYLFAWNLYTKGETRQTLAVPKTTPKILRKESLT
jgi:hypothetical protein